MELSDIDAEPMAGANMCEISDSVFEPQSRLRANTWPVRPQGFSTSEEESKSSTPPVPENPSEGTLEYAADTSKDSGSSGVIGKKGGTRRNAWGSLSYADLISKAIDNSPEKRLTLSQIYDWMVQNVPYFKDKGDNNSSAGWKNSIRHNLSLHNRFMRVQNEGTGKSSWWIINPDAKPGKTPRRRAASMDPKEMSKKRGRAKKRVDEIRSGDFKTYRQHSNPGSEYSSTNDLSSIGGDPFTISPLDIRARTGSNASSFGRLSPIQAGLEPELDDGFGSNWGDCIPNGKDFVLSDRHFMSGAESVSEHLAELFMGDGLPTVPEKMPSLGDNHTPSMKVEQGGFHLNPPAYSSHLNAMNMQSQRGSFGVVRPDGIGSVSGLSQHASLSPVHGNEVFKNSDQYSPGGSAYSNKSSAAGMSLRDLLSDGVDFSQQQLRQNDFAPDMKFVQECNPLPNRNQQSPKEITRSLSGSSFVPSIRISPQQPPHQQPMMIRGITSTILQQQQQIAALNSQHVPNSQVLRNLQQRVSNDNLLQAVQMRGMQQQMLRSPTPIKQEPSSYPASPIMAKSEPVSPVSCLPHSPPVNHLTGSRYSGSDLTRFVKQEHHQHTHPTLDCMQMRVPPPPLPMDLDFSLQELRAGGLECDMDRILQEGNFDLEFQTGIGIYGDAPYS